MLFGPAWASLQRKFEKQISKDVNRKSLLLTESLETMLQKGRPLHNVIFDLVKPHCDSPLLGWITVQVAEGLGQGRFLYKWYKEW